MVAKEETSLRVLMFPWLAHGHIFPFLELSKKLSKLHFHIYFCSTPINLDSVRKILKKDSSDDNNDVLSIELVELHLPSLPQLPPYYHTTKNIPPHLMPTLMEAFQMSSSNFSDIITNLKPNLLIFDTFQPWAAKFAKSQNIPCVYFLTSGSTAFSFFHHYHTHKNYDTFPYPAIFLREYEKRNQIAENASIIVKDMDEEGFAFGVFQLSCDIVLVKSCRGIEGKYMDYLSTLCNKKIVPTGPLISTNGEKNQESGNYSEIIDWLSQKSQFSTLYISFGSENYMSKEQMQELAKGLELSGVNFIWVARTPIGSDIFIEEALSEGLLDKIKQNGIIVQGWAPQAEILAHSSVGGFMSHCGWSSITESLYFGVPVVAVPLKFDQPVNCRMAVEAGVGVEVMRDENGMFDGNGVAKAINEVILEESGEKRRCKARELSRKVKMEDEDAFYDQVAEELSRICVKTY
ncbi:hypothetical protein DH2020_020023 [Rehmannia glutinosa]|uniref:Glycosyltransferase n=1 Tax=Rehmannia glutinosa TaxID=99300 RepID=A0ABR0WGG3_REHGL